MALGQEHCEKGGWTCSELASSSWIGIRAEGYSSDEERWEMEREEDVSDAQHGGASSRRGILRYELQERFTSIKCGDKLFVLPKDTSKSSLFLPSACYYVQ